MLPLVLQVVTLLDRISFLNYKDCCQTVQCLEFARDGLRNSLSRLARSITEEKEASYSSKWCFDCRFRSACDCAPLYRVSTRRHLWPGSSGYGVSRWRYRCMLESEKLNTCVLHKLNQCGDPTLCSGFACKNSIVIISISIIIIIIIISIIIDNTCETNQYYHLQ